MDVVIKLYNEAEEQPSCFFATIADSDKSTPYAASARDATVSHALNVSRDNNSRCNKEFSYGVLVDTGCA